MKEWSPMQRQWSLIIIGLLVLNMLLGRPFQGGTTHDWTPEIEWTRTYGGNNDDWGNTVQQTLNGGYILCGSTKSYGAGGSDAWLLKTEATGSLEWNQTFGGVTEDSAQFVQQTRDGGYIVLGDTVTYDSLEIDVWLIKLDHMGNSQWKRTITGLSSLQSSIRQTVDGGYILAGMDNTDYWLEKMDSSGNMIWNRTLNRQGQGNLWDVIQTTDGGYILVGDWWVTLPGTVVTGDARVVKTNAEGHVEWDYTYGGSSTESGKAIQQTKDDGYIMVGNHGSSRYWLVKLNTQGEIQWEQSYYSDLNEVAYAVEQTVDGGYILAGITRPDRLIPKGPTAAWLVKTDKGGNYEWEFLLNETRRDGFYRVRQTADSGYILVGWTYSATNGSDVLLMKFGPDRSFVEENRLALLIPLAPLLLLLIVWVRRIHKASRVKWIM